MHADDPRFAVNRYNLATAYLVNQCEEHWQRLVVLSLTDGIAGPGIDWARLECHRRHLVRILLGRRIVDATAEELDAVHGILAILDWLTDLAVGAGSLKRQPE